MDMYTIRHTWCHIMSSSDEVTDDSSVYRRFFERRDWLLKHWTNNRYVYQWTSLTLVMRRIKELSDLWFFCVQLVLLTRLSHSVPKESVEFKECVNQWTALFSRNENSPFYLEALNDWIVLSKTLDLDDIEVESADLISDKGFGWFQAIEKLRIAFTWAFSVMIAIREIVFRFTGRNRVGTLVMLSATSIRFPFNSQIVVMICNVSGSTPDGRWGKSSKGSDASQILPFGSRINC